MPSIAPRRLRVLVVDDDDDIRDAIREILEAAGYEVGTAADGALACALLEHGELPDVVLLDLMMPVIDGWGVLRRIREDPRLHAVSVIVMSAGGRDAAAAVPDGVPFVKKPLDLTVLFAALRNGAGEPG